jgi:hypothetical protein
METNQDVQIGIDTSGFGPKLLDTRQVADILNVSPGWVRDHSMGKSLPRIPALKMGEGKTSVVRFHPSDVFQFIEEQRKQAKARGTPQARWRR